jgi:hypothetical protein
MPAVTSLSAESAARLLLRRQTTASGVTFSQNFVATLRMMNDDLLHVMLLHDEE